MPNRPRPVRLSDVLTLDDRGLPQQVHFPKIKGQEVRIGPAFASRQAAQARLGHVLEVTVSGPSDAWTKTWFERSQVGQPDMYGHTEQKAVPRMRLAAGLTIVMRGYHPPCPYKNGCLNALEILARTRNVDFTYLVEQADRFAEYEFSAVGRKSGLAPVRR